MVMKRISAIALSLSLWGWGYGVAIAAQPSLGSSFRECLERTRSALRAGLL